MPRLSLCYLIFNENYKKVIKLLTQAYDLNTITLPADLLYQHFAAKNRTTRNH
jgi:hypothetical protein